MNTLESGQSELWQPSERKGEVDTDGDSGVGEGTPFSFRPSKFSAVGPATKDKKETKFFSF